MRRCSCSASRRAGFGLFLLSGPFAVNHRSPHFVQLPLRPQLLEGLCRPSSLQVVAVVVVVVRTQPTFKVCWKYRAFRFRPRTSLPEDCRQRRHSLKDPSKIKVENEADNKKG
jgi:hypothetical protein